MNSLKRYVLCGGAGLTLQPFASMILYFAFSFFKGAADTYSANVGSLFERSITMVLYVVIVSPFFEELIFRYVILGLGQKYMKFIFANVLQAAMFGLYHMNLVQGIYAFILGMFIGWLKIISGSIWGCMVFHSVFNACGLILQIVLPEDLSVGSRITIAVVSFGLTVFLLYNLLHEYYQKNKG